MELAIIVSIFLFVFGLIGVINGEFKITGKRWVDSSTGRLMGIIMLVGAVAPFCIGGWFAFFAQWGSLILAIAIGLARSEEIETLKSSAAKVDHISNALQTGSAPLEATGRYGAAKVDHISNALQSAIKSIREGDEERGKRLLGQVIQADPRNEMAWLWWTQVVDSDEERLVCLRKVLDINPNNESAKRGLAALTTKENQSA